ncbi:hypothetical protein B9479_001332 [Cryptococcus floricola]|uniref:tRNA (guanine(37)-N1)-methyltransferase n=1 Tax=Cryptococcus floricola TaxID=2591691 RepID=A0A5D3B557_9TREE|nr:hypothetical protein B9479_001332 [Cryptococcus floricola]
MLRASIYSRLCKPFPTPRSARSFTSPHIPSPRANRTPAYNMSLPPSLDTLKLSGRSSISPPKQKGMTKLDRSAFDISIDILGVIVEPRDVTKIRALRPVRELLLELPKIRPITDCPPDQIPASCKDSQNLKVLWLNVASYDDIAEETRALLEQYTKGTARDTVAMGYDNFGPTEILEACLPTDKSDDFPSSFTTTGHIGHMNLREEWLPFRFLIGQVILDKNPALRTVVNKLDTIHAQFRYFDMEVIAGDADYLTTANESGCSFTFDFSKVYWNSRLHHEHERLISLFPPQSLVADVMAGVGPFAVPAAKKGCYVMGNDLNPESVKWMRENRLRNKVETTLRVTEVDGHEFIRIAPLQAWTDPFEPALPPRAPNRKEAREARRKRDEAKAQGLPAPVGQETEPTLPPAPKLISHFVMNLPDSALTFLGNYIGSYSSLLSEPTFVQQYGQAGEEKVELGMVHCYCFTKEIEPEKAEVDILQRASHYLEYGLTPQAQDYNLHLVRSVAPNKDMYCLSFRLPRQVAFAKRS